MKYFLKLLFLIINLSIVDLVLGQDSNQAVINVSTETRAKFEALLASDPTFKNKAFFKKCLDGSISDPYCEKGISGYIENHISEKQLNESKAEVNARKAEVNARKAEVNAREAEVNAREVQVKELTVRSNALKARVELTKEVIFHLDISHVLLQLANYVEFKEPFPKNSEDLNAVLSSEKTPQEIKDFIKSIKERADKKDILRYNSEWKILLGHVRNNLDVAANKLKMFSEKDITYDNLEKTIAVLNQGYMALVEVGNKKMNQRP